MPPLMQLPSAQITNALVNFAPINDAIDANRQNALASRKLDQVDTHLGLERQKVDIAGAQHAETMRKTKMDEFGKVAQAISETKDPAMREQLVGIAQQRHGDLISHAAEKGADINHPDYWKAMSWHAQNYDPQKDDLQRAQTADANMSAAVKAATLQQVKTQTPEWREANAERFGIMKGTPEYQQFIFNGQLKDDTFKLKDDETLRQKIRMPDGSYSARTIAGGEGGGLKANDKAKAEAEMRKEVNKYATDYTTIRDAHGQIDAISKQPSAASDIAMVFSFMKILDPGSVVREGEYATAARAQGIPERIVSILEKAKSGQFLSPEQRQDFLNVAATIATSKRQFYQAKLDQYKGVAERTKINPNNVVLPEGTADNPRGGATAPAAPAPAAPAPAAPARAAPARAAPSAAPKMKRGRNSQTGEEIEWNGSQWVPSQRGGR